MLEPKLMITTLSIDLQQYVGLTNLRIRFTYSGTTKCAIDIQIPNKPIKEVIEWTDDME
jgi:hypothetical protein